MRCCEFADSNTVWGTRGTGKIREIAKKVGSKAAESKRRSCNLRAILCNFTTARLAARLIRVKMTRASRFLSLLGVLAALFAALFLNIDRLPPAAADILPIVSMEFA